MSRVVAIHQPNYLPWLGYFAKMAQCDVFVLLDNVQLSRGSFTNRVRIKTREGTPWLTVPFSHPGGSAYPAICDAKVDYGQRWPSKHLRTLSQAYARANHTATYLPPLRQILEASYPSLAALNEVTIGFLADALDVRPVIARASELQVEGHRNELLAAICKTVGGDTYLVGQGGGLTYTDEAYFAAQGLVVQRQQFAHPTYRQQHGDFAAGLTALDLLLNEGPAAADLLREAGLPAERRA